MNCSEECRCKHHDLHRNTSKLVHGDVPVKDYGAKRGVPRNAQRQSGFGGESARQSMARLRRGLSAGSRLRRGRRAVSFSSGGFGANEGDERASERKNKDWPPAPLFIAGVG